MSINQRWSELSQEFFGNSGNAQSLETYDWDFASSSNILSRARNTYDTKGEQTANALPEISLCFASETVSPGAQGWKTTREFLRAGEEKITHEHGGSVSEEWLIKRDAVGSIISVEPQIGKDTKPDKQNLNDARRILIDRIDSSKVDEAEKMRLFQMMQRLEQNAREGKMGSVIEGVRTDLASVYLHTAGLLSLKAPASAVADSLATSSQNTVKHFGETAGNLTADGKRADLKKENGEQREAREDQIWNARMTSFDDTAKVSISLNGKKVESWKIKSAENKVIEVLPILHPDPQPDREGLRESRQALVAAISRSEMSAEAKLEFFKDMAHIEHRARAGEMGSDIAQVRREVSDTYKQLGRLLDDGKQYKVPLKERVVLARQLGHQLADTMNIDQGNVSDACRITTVECRLSVKRPALVARIVADTALDGALILANQQIKLDSESLKPASDFATKFPRPQSERSYASQLFQLTCMNLLGTDSKVVNEHIHFTNLDETKPKFPQYDRLIFQQRKEGERNEKGELFKRNNGMVVYGVRNGRMEQLTKPGELREGTNQPLLQACMSQRLLDMIDPGKHTGSVLAHRDVDLYARENHNGEAPGDTRGLVLFADQKELEALIAKAKREGRLPLIIATKNYDADPGEKAPDLQRNESNHVITIRDYTPADPKTGVEAKVVTDDQFGRIYDERNIPLTNLYDVTKPGLRKK